MTTTYRIECGEECDSKRKVPEYQWWYCRNTTNKDWQKDLKDLRKYNPKTHYRVVKSVTITEVLTEIIA